MLQSSPYTTFNTFTTTNGQVFTLGATYNWVGSSNTDFGNASNFRSQNGSTVSATPTSTDQVQIGVTSYQYPYNQPTVGVNTAVAKIIIGTNNTPAITVSSGVTLTISGIGGGTTTPLTFNSSAALTVNGPGTFSLGGPTTIPSGSTLTLGPTSVLSLANSTSTLTNNGTLNLLSTAAGSAAIAAIPSGASISGSANIQRFITGTNSTYRSYRLLTSPVNLSTSSVPSTNISLSYINTTQTLSGTVYHGALTGGPGGTGSGFSVFNANPTMYLYNESLASSNSGFTSGKPVGIVAIGSSTINTLSKGVTTTGVSVPVANGYFFYFIGDNSTTATAPTRVIQGTAITASGYINQGNVPVKIWNTPTSSYLSYASLVNPGFNLIGNPYPCAIDLNQVYADNSTSTGFTTFWIALDQNPGQQFVSYNAQSGARSNTTYSSQYIASGQGFLVQATATNQSITFKETEKAPYAALSSTSSPVLQLSLHQSESLSLKSTTDNTSKTLALTDNPAANSGLHLKLSADSITNDECGIYFSSKWSDNYDNNDAYDLDGISPTVYLSSLTANGVRVGINSLGSYLKGKKVKLFVKASATGSYNLRLADIENIDTALFDINLIDNSAKDSVDILHSSKGYTFTITTTDTTTFGTERFVLSVQRKPLPPYQLLSFAGQKATGGIALNWKTENEGTYTGFSIQKLIGNADYTTLYSVQSNSAGTYSYTDPNPVTGNNVYRLVQNNIDSINTYSKPINVVYNIASPLGLLTVYPNPAKDQITINFNSAAYNQPVSGNYQTSIYNSTGIAVIKKSTSGNSSWSQDITALQPGSYVIEVKSNDGSLIGNAKFVKYQ